MNKQKKISLAIVVASLLLVNFLYAQESRTLDNITVTANKMEEDIKDIPQSITVITDVEIEERGIKNINDLIKFIPNLTSSSLNADKVNFRGINNSHFTNTNPVIIYVDGIPHSDMYGFDKTISNVLRVEVLRGPQGTIYGKDSMGGVINIITKEPSDTLEGNAAAEYGTDNYQEAAFNISSPLIENKLFFGLNGIYSHSDGYGTNHHPDQRKDANEEEKYLFNGNLKYKPSDNLSVKLNINNNKSDIYGIKGGLAPFGTDTSSYERDDFENVFYEDDVYLKTKSNSQALHVDYEFADMTFSSLTTHSNAEMDTNLDMDFSNTALWDDLSTFTKQETRNISQEFRLSRNRHSLKWIAGLYYENEKMDIDKWGGQFPGFMMGNPFGEGVAVDNNAISENDSETFAAFGQVMIPFLTNFELTLGGRYQRIEKETDIDFYSLPFGTKGDPAFTLADDHTWDAFLPKLALSYRINNDLTSYFSVTQGFLAGGYNHFPSSAVIDQNRFDEQRSTNYELGIRGHLLDNRLYLSAAVFYMDIEDLHVSLFDTQTGTGYTSNAGEAYSQGVELEAGYSINDNWRIDTAIGLIEAKYDEYTDVGGNDYNDNKIMMTPSHTANIGVSYLNDKGLYGRLDVRNQGKIYFDNANTQKEDSYTTANIKAGYLFGDWDIYGYVNNITDESYLTTVTQFPAGNILTFGDGRFIGIGAKYCF